MKPDSRVTSTPALVALLVGIVLASCSRPQNNGAADTGVGEDVTTPRDAEKAEDSGEETDADPGDMDVPDLPACSNECGEHERALPSDCTCVAWTDRRCNGDIDCREGEECREMDGYSVCWYEPPPVRTCPGSEGCTGEGDGVLYAAAARKAVTPLGFETPTAEGLDGVRVVRNPYTVFSPEYWNDCGLDGICPEDDGYPGPDEGEGDSEPQAVWIAGFSTGRAAQYCPEAQIGCEGPECCISKYAHDDIEVNLVVLRQNGVTVVFASLDTVGFFHSDIERIREAVQASVDVDLLVMAATHNHEAPDTAGQWGPGTPAPTSTGKRPEVIERIRTQTVAGIEEAIDALQPAEVAATVVDAGTDGLAISDSRTPYIFDDNLPIVHVTARDDGETIGTLFSFGNHAEVRWSDNVHLTADYYGFARRYIEQGLAATTDVDSGEDLPALEGLGGVTVSFAAAVGGLINPGRGGAKDYAGNAYEGDQEHSWAATDALGQSLAKRVLTAYHDGGLTPLDDPQLSFATKRFLVDVENRQLQLAGLALNLIERDIYNTVRIGGAYKPGPFPKVLSQVAVVRLGDLTFFTAPGEAFPELLVGGYPNRPRIQTPIVGDVEERRVAATCDDQGLPTPDDDGTFACIIEKDAENPPDWSMAPEGPYAYERIPGEYPFFIGLGMDFLGYMVPLYDYEEIGYFNQAPGDHYEETNGIGRDIVDNWLTNLQTCVDALP
jgi:hypothetical protein